MRDKPTEVRVYTKEYVDIEIWVRRDGLVAKDGAGNILDTLRITHVDDCFTLSLNGIFKLAESYFQRTRENVDQLRLPLDA